MTSRNCTVMFDENHTKTIDCVMNTRTKLTARWPKSSSIVWKPVELKRDIKFSKRVENTMGKGEITHYEQFLLFQQCFQKTGIADTHTQKKTQSCFGKGKARFSLKTVYLCKKFIHIYM